MSETYIGWDGKSYPWPPPDGWYHASDGRWWAGETGPNPPSLGGQPSTSPPQASPPTQVASDAGIHTAPLPTYGAENAQSTAEQSPSLFSHDGPTATTPPQVDYGPEALPDQALGLGRTVPSGPPDGPPGYDNGPGAAASSPGRQAATSGSGIGQALLIIGGIVAAVLVGGFAYFILTADDVGQTATGNTTETSAGNGSETTTETTIDSETDETDTTDTSDQATETSDQTTETSDQATDTDTTSDTDTTTAPLSSLVAEFRGILEDNDLTSDSLSDDQIQTFATDFCARAGVAEDSEAFEDIRQAAIAGTESELTAEELGLVIDAAVMTFCPAEAERLDVDV